MAIELFEFYCKRYCIGLPVEIESLRADDVNVRAGITCAPCHFVIAAITTDEFASDEQTQKPPAEAANETD